MTSLPFSGDSLHFLLGKSLRFFAQLFSLISRSQFDIIMPIRFAGLDGLEKEYFQVLSNRIEQGFG
jgi:hypothetical protein